jgi:hypothetical protein
MITKSDCNSNIIVEIFQFIFMFFNGWSDILCSVNSQLIETVLATQIEFVKLPSVLQEDSNKTLSSMCCSWLAKTAWPLGLASSLRRDGYFCLAPYKKKGARPWFLLMKIKFKRLNLGVQRSSGEGGRSWHRFWFSLFLLGWINPPQDAWTIARKQGKPQRKKWSLTGTWEA